MRVEIIGKNRDRDTHTKKKNEEIGKLGGYGGKYREREEKSLKEQYMYGKKKQSSKKT